MLTLPNLVLSATAVCTALIAGLFYAYSCSVNPGLGRLTDAQYLAAMQSINRAILNPVFFVSFMGTLMLLPVSTWLHYTQPLSNRFWLLLAATVLYATAVFGVTVMGNVPLNEALDTVNLPAASESELATARATFEQPWNRLHAVRTVAAVIALVLVVLACFQPAKLVEP
ncbi:DUF1772 domain-containing protein [Fibrella sp. WM1]|uniref:anthrone oxygenase family protein n=1 Tax=Fibrella musci TaxID=3242485 RepID=UPI0035215332